MRFFFLLCAVIGATVFVVQFLLTLLGIGADHLDVGVDLPDDVDLSVDHGGDFGAHDVPDHGSTWLFGMISFKTVVAAIAFFGLGGLLLMDWGATPAVTIIGAVASGLGAMYGVHFLMKQLWKLRHDGTARIEWTVGEAATVYVPIPPGRTGQGKVQIRTAEGIRECRAVTDADQTLPTGATVRVVGVVGESVVEVRLEQKVEETAESGAGSD